VFGVEMEIARTVAQALPDLAFYYAVLDEHDAAIRALEQGLRARAPMMLQVGPAPCSDALRGDERMERLRCEVGFR
jgi:hypothetical protein